MSARSLALFACFIAALGLATTGCQQAEGEVCQLHSDCESGLSCCEDSPTVAGRGICHAVCPMTVLDSGIPSEVDSGTGEVDAGDAGGGAVDSGVIDSGSDAGSDSGAGDSGAADSGVVDSGTGASDSGGDAA